MKYLRETTLTEENDVQFSRKDLREIFAFLPGTCFALRSVWCKTEKQDGSLENLGYKIIRPGRGIKKVLIVSIVRSKTGYLDHLSLATMI